MPLIKVTSIIVHEDVLHVIVAGKFDLEEAKRAFVQVMEAVSKNGSIRVLIDGRAVTGEPTVIERFIYGSFAANVATWGKADVETRHSHQFAYVLVYPTLDDRRRGENAAVNQGMNLRVFENLSDAAAWLDIDPKQFGVHAASGIDTGAADQE